jgi:AhpD family alkylhydroperoxidase
MARHPSLLRGWIAFSTALRQLDGVDPGLKVLMSHLASSANGCRFCEAHTTKTAVGTGVDPEKISHVWEFETDDRFSDAERSALRLARDMGLSPNAVTPAHFDDLRQYFDDDQLVEMIATVCSFGFWNRWNDTVATDLEEPVHRVASALLTGRGWAAGKHHVEGCEAAVVASGGVDA